MSYELSKAYLHVNNGGLSLRLIEENGVFGIQAEYNHFGMPSVKNFIPLAYVGSQYDYFFREKDDSLGTEAYSGLNWLIDEMNKIQDWSKDPNNPNDFKDYLVTKKLSEKIEKE